VAEAVLPSKASFGLRCGTENTGWIFGSLLTHFDSQLILLNNTLYNAEIMLRGGHREGAKSDEGGDEKDGYVKDPSRCHSFVGR
jgi:hypothetical protein